MTRLPQRAGPTLPDRFRSKVQLMAWRGVATMAAAALAQMMVRQALRQVTPSVLRTPSRRGAHSIVPTAARQPGQPAEWGSSQPVEIQEAVVIRRVRFRR